VLRPREFPDTRASMLSAMRGAAGDSAWREFFACYAPPVFRVARHLGLSAEDADDVVQQVMVAVAQHIADFRYNRDRGRFRSWVQSITRNKVRDRRRRAARGHEHDTVPYLDGHDGQTDADEPSADVWAAEWRLQDTLWCLEQVRQEVSPHRFEAFRLYVIEGVPAADVAAQVGMTRGHVYVTRSQIARRVRELLAELDAKQDEEP
jgi:RNA polymerase sigma-70 factor, ECF subfamily